MKPAEQCIFDQAEPFCSILLELKILFETTVPDVELVLGFGLPFHYLGANLFVIAMLN